MGFYCPEQQTTPDFLTGLTSTLERRPREGFEKQVPHTAEEFEVRWKSSPEYKALKQELAEYENKYPVNGPLLEDFKANRRHVQSKHMYVVLYQSSGSHTRLTGPPCPFIAVPEAPTRSPTAAKSSSAFAADSRDSRPTRRSRERLSA